MDLDWVIKHFDERLPGSVGEVIRGLFCGECEHLTEDLVSKGISLVISYCVLPNTVSVPEALNLRSSVVSFNLKEELLLLLKSLHVPLGNLSEFCSLIYNDTLMILCLVNTEFTVELARLLPAYVKIPPLLWLMTYSPTHRVTTLNLLGYAIAQEGGVKSLLETFGKGDDTNKLRGLAVTALCSPPGKINKNEYYSKVAAQALAILLDGKPDRYSRNLLGECLNLLLYKDEGLVQEITEKIDLSLNEDGAIDSKLLSFAEMLNYIPPHRGILFSLVKNFSTLMGLLVYTNKYPTLAIKQAIETILKKLFVYWEDIPVILTNLMENPACQFEPSLNDSGDIVLIRSYRELESFQLLEISCNFINEVLAEEGTTVANIFSHLLSKYTHNENFECIFMIIYLTEHLGQEKLFISPMHVKQFLYTVLQNRDDELLITALSVLSISLKECHPSCEDKKFLIEITPQLAQLKTHSDERIKELAVSLDKLISQCIQGIASTVQEKKLKINVSELPYEIAFNLFNLSQKIIAKQLRIEWEYLDAALLHPDPFVLHHLVQSYKAISQLYIAEAIEHLISLYNSSTSSKILEIMYQIILSYKKVLISLSDTISNFTNSILLNNPTNEEIGGAYMTFSALCKNIKVSSFKYLPSIIPIILRSIEQSCSQLYQDHQITPDLSASLYLLRVLFKHCEFSHLNDFLFEITQKLSLLRTYNDRLPYNIQILLTNTENLIESASTEQLGGVHTSRLPYIIDSQ